MMPLRRMRVKYLSYHNPKVWEASFEPPGRVTCYCHAKTLDEMMGKITDYFLGYGSCPPQHVDERLKQYLRPKERYVGLTYAERISAIQSEVRR